MALVLTNAGSVSVASIIFSTQVEIIASIDSVLAVDAAWVDCSVDEVVTVFTRLDDTISAIANISWLSTTLSAGTELRSIDDLTLHRITQGCVVAVASASLEVNNTLTTTVGLSERAFGAEAIFILDPVTHAISASAGSGIQRLTVRAGSNTSALAIGVINLIARRAGAVGTDTVANVGVIHSNLWWCLCRAVQVANTSTGW